MRTAAHQDRPPDQPAESTQPRPSTRRSGRTLLWLAGCAAGAVALLAAAVPAIARAGSGSVVFFACVNNSNGTIRIVPGTRKCRSFEHKISWNQKGPQGPQGPAGVVSGTVDYGPASVTVNNTLNTVLNLALPAGRYIVTATAIFGTNGSADLFGCILTDGSGKLITSASMDLPADAVGFGGSLGTVSMTGATVDPGSVTLKCKDRVGTDFPDVESPVITAVPVAQLQVTGTPH